MELPLLQSSQLQPLHVQPPINWAGHIPFAFWVMEAAEPEVFVELGTHTANSYFAFCQSVERHHLSTHCYAVDSWQGDEHAGSYGDEVYEHVAAYNQSHYSTFSSLMRMTFDESLHRFADGSIDLLHIDGMHTYEAVRHDFETWLPKMSEKGIVLFHDITVRERGFGVWKLWEELSARYPNICFNHSHGLGVLFTGIRQSSTIQALLAEWTSAESQTFLQNFFALSGERITLDYTNGELSRRVQEQESQIIRLSGELQERERRIETLRGDYNRIANSGIWRIMKPLRKIGRWLNKRLR